MNGNLLERPFNNTIKEPGISNPSLENDSSLILDILSGLRNKKTGLPSIPVTKEKNEIELKTFEDNLKKKQEKLMRKMQQESKELIFHIEKSKEKLLKHKLSKKLLRRRIKLQSRRENKLIEQEEKREEKAFFFLRNTLINENKPKEIRLNVITVKYSSILNYTFLATFGKGNLINLADIELERFMNLPMKEIFIKNLTYLDEKYMLGSYLRFNTICAFNEIGEKGTKFKKLSEFLSYAKIGVQFLIIKNDYFTNKTLILFHKDNFPFKNFFEENEFYIMKVDKDFLDLDYSEKRNEILQMRDGVAFVPDTELNLNRSESISRLKLKAEVAGRLRLNRKIKSLKKIKKVYSSIDNCFRRRKAQKVKEDSNKSENQNRFEMRAGTDGRHFNDYIAFGNNNNNTNHLNYENNLNSKNNEIENNYNQNDSNNIDLKVQQNQNQFDSSFFGKFYLLNYLLLNNPNKCNNQNICAFTNSDRNVDKLVNESEIDSRNLLVLDSGNIANSTRTGSNYDKNEIRCFVDRKYDSKIVINLHSYEVVHIIQDAYANNQWITYEERNRIPSDRSIYHDDNKEEGILCEEEYNINSF